MRALLLTLTTCLLVLPAYAKYSGGTGEPNDPYQIATAADLIALGETPTDYDKHFILTADIDLDPNLPGRKVFDKAVIAPDRNDRNSWFDGTPFTGVFDGNSHTVSHLTINGEEYLGLFGELARGGEIKALGVVNVSVTGTGFDIGGLVGENCGTVTDCYSTGVVRGYRDVGGLVGYNEGGTLTNCHSTCAVDGPEAGGLVGDNGGTVTRCYSTGAVSGIGWSGGLVGENYGTVTDCCSTGVVTHGGGLVGKNMGIVSQSYSTGAVNGWGGGLIDTNGDPRTNGWPAFVTHCYSTGAVRGGGGLVGDNDGTVTASFWDTQKSGQATSAGGTGLTTAEMQDPNTLMSAGWDFVNQPDGPHDIWAEPNGGGYPVLFWQLPAGFGLPDFSGGTGEPNDPYLISKGEELNNIGHNPRLMGCHFKLTGNVDLAGIYFNPIGGLGHPYMLFQEGSAANYPYVGIFDGNGNTISHLTVIGESYLGLFGLLGVRAEVRDLGVVDVNITGSGDPIGGLVGSSGLWDTPGGIVKSCYSTGAVSGNADVGGLVGENYGLVTQCYSEANTSGCWAIGGLVGDNIGGTVTQCYSTPAVSGNSFVGGLVGYNLGGQVKQCHSTGAVRGSTDVGGLVGGSRGGEATNCFWDTQTSGQATSDGGTGKTTAEMQTASTFSDAGWDFVGETANGKEDIWWIDEGKDYPRLWWEAAEEPSP